MRPLAVGDILDGKYEIEGQLGEGAMGLVYSARHRALNRRVAVKTLRAEIARDADLVQRFEQEARAASAIGHPNIIQVFDLGLAASGARYMVMEHLEGEGLSALLVRDKTVAPARIAHIMEQVLSALGAAHRRGIVHRDLKPENIFMAHVEDRGAVVKLLDFGISKVLEMADPRIAGADAAARATRFGTVMGTPLYMAPEQARGLTDIDHRADLWSVGVVLYEMATGKMPFDGDNYNQILGAILDGRYPPPRARNPAVPEALEQVIVRALSQRREERYQSAQEMRVALLASVGPALAPAAAHAAPPSADGLDLDAVDVADGLQVKPLAGVSADDARMLAALERLASGTAEVEVGASGASAPRPVPAPPPVAAPVPRVAFGPAARRPDDRFAPPADDSEELRLDVDGDAGLSQRLVARDQERAAPAPARVSTREPAASRPSTGHAVAAPSRSGGGLGTMLTLVLVIGVLGGGGFALYRYLTVGYLLSPPPPKTALIAIQVAPAEAELTLDGEPLAAPTFALEVGASRRVGARSRDRLAVERTVTATDREVPPVVIRLPHRLRPIVPGALAPAAGGGDPGERGEAAVDAALAKVDRYLDCVAPLAGALSASRDGYLRTSGGSEKKLRAGAPPEVAPIPVDISGACRMAVDGARGEPPALAGIDDAASRLMPAVDELAALALEVGDYYRAGKHRVDDLRWGKRKHAELVAAYDKAWAAHQKVAVATAARRAWWERRELDLLAERDGVDAHWHLRRVALAAQAWLWAELGGAPASDARTRLDELTAALAEARTFTGSHGDPLSALTGGAAYLAAAAELVTAAGTGGRAAAGTALPIHNRSIELFNRMVL